MSETEGKFVAVKRVEIGERDVVIIAGPGVVPRAIAVAQADPSFGLLLGGGGGEPGVLYAHVYASRLAFIIE
jgi:hypothetical protein